MLDVKSVQYAILETNGALSVFLYPKERPASAKEAGIPVKEQALPVTIVADGKIYPENLLAAKKDRTWVDKTLSARGATLRDTFLLTVDGKNKVVFLSKEDAK